MRSDRSWPTVRPATWSQPSATDTWSARLPITATSSTSQSTSPGGSAISPVGPVRQVTNLVNTVGSSGTENFDSLACSA
ncbi:hypothetical protein BCF44_10278 [Kutzneria buriramensis]|uniref:Uncharacterized protein n=1 Tax=Kutzneria buriramensis TaxID=1045776 RepID=A0A3E0I5E1_9PSEU|nr:hypothetical protein BCF44_10278 [Kutzneria buriramensis]